MGNNTKLSAKLIFRNTRALFAIRGYDGVMRTLPVPFSFLILTSERGKVLATRVGPLQCQQLIDFLVKKKRVEAVVRHESVVPSRAR